MLCRNCDSRPGTAANPPRPRARSPAGELSCTIGIPAASALPHGVRVEVIREEQLDAIEARGLGRGDAFERRQLREQEPDVGGEFQSAAILAAAPPRRTPDAQKR